MRLDRNPVAFPIPARRSPPSHSLQRRSIRCPHGVREGDAYREIRQFIRNDKTLDPVVSYVALSSSTALCYLSVRILLHSPTVPRKALVRCNKRYAYRFSRTPVRQQRPHIASRKHDGLSNGTNARLRSRHFARLASLWKAHSRSDAWNTRHSKKMTGSRKAGL